MTELLPLSPMSLRVAIGRRRRVFGRLLLCCLHAILCWIHPLGASIVLVSSCAWVGRHHPQQQQYPQQAPSHDFPPPSSTAPTVRYRARVAYNGYRYQGFQLQPSRAPAKQCKKHRSATTIQGELERVLNQRWGVKTGNYWPTDDNENDYPRAIKVVAAGRTDAGVHARGQAIHFDVPAVRTVGSEKQEHGESDTDASTAAKVDERDQHLWNDTTTTILDNDEKVLFHLNKKLPPDIRIWNLQRVPGPVTKEVPVDVMSSDATTGEGGETTTTTTRTYLWNAMYECTRKLYSYRLALGPVMPPTERHSRWHYPGHHNHRMDPERLRRVLKHFEGTHNFAAFASAVERTERKLAEANENAARSTVLNTIRHVYSVDLVQEDAQWGFYRVDVCLQGALYKQVRNMVGTALVVAAANNEQGKKGQATIMTEADMVALLRYNPEGGGGPRLQRQHNKCRPAPPEGLTLEHVYFDNDPGF